MSSLRNGKYVEEEKGEEEAEEEEEEEEGKSGKRPLALVYHQEKNQKRKNTKKTGCMKQCARCGFAREYASESSWKVLRGVSSSLGQS